MLLFSCSDDSDSGAYQNANGQGGSLARFVVLHNYLYTVDNADLKVFHVADANNPVFVNSVNVGFDIETLFVYKDYLYIGSRTGMYIYSAANPENPQFLSNVQHFTACDPVVANERYAFVSLHTNVACEGTLNQVEMYDVEDVTNPVLLSVRELQRPIGMALYGDYLFVCDDEVKIFDVSNPAESTLVNSINQDTFDAIIYNDNLILIGNSGLYQYSLNPNDITDVEYLSTMNVYSSSSTSGI